MENIAAIATIFALSAAPLPQPPNVEMQGNIKLEAPVDHLQRWTKSLPCPTGSFSTVITVLNPVEHGQYQSGALVLLFGSDDDPGIFFSFETEKRVLPLVVQVNTIGKTTKDILSHQQSGRNFAPGESVTLQVTWVRKRSFTFLVNGNETYKVALDQPVTDLHLQAVGSRTIFDKNVIRCNFVS
jgi:hypothetical protein